MSTTKPIHLQGIELGKYLKLLEEHAFGKKDPGHYPKLRFICRSIATRLEGLPQAAETYGQALRSKLHKNHWRTISKRKMHQMGAGKRDIMTTLRLSYEQLLADLKECFVSCSLFPKGYVFEKEEIIRVWMALGFLGAGDGGEQMESRGKKNITQLMKTSFSRDGEERMEDRGKKNFTQLLKRSFFKKNNESPGTYLIPGPLHELAEFLSSGEYFRIERSEFDDGPIDIPLRAHHVYLDINDLVRASEELRQITNLCSLLIVGMIASSSEKLIQKLEEVLGETTHLRLLMVSELLPTTLAQLKRLRYLQILITITI
uniref:Disease resistance protein winged helix domain-containing protein n=1 Tax=Arundo donax TaxID=35708 RepID=A0A0A9H972_ARUDO